MSSWGFSSQFFFRPSSKVPMAPRSLPPPSMKSPAGPRWRMPCWRPSIIPRMKMCSLDEEFSHFRGHNSAWKNGGFAQVSATEMVRWIPVFVEYCGCPMNVKNKHVSTVIVVPPCSLGGRLAPGGRKLRNSPSQCYKSRPRPDTVSSGDHGCLNMSQPFKRETWSSLMSGVTWADNL